MDNAKIALAVAEAMDKLDSLVEHGDIPENAEVAAAYVVVALDYPTPDDTEDRHLLSDTTTDVFVWGTPQSVYIQISVLTMGLDNVTA